jgi:hypothetical protein
VQAEAERLEHEERIRAQQDADKNSGGAQDSQSGSPASKPKPVAKPKPVVDVTATSVFNKVSSGIYLETKDDIDSFVQALKEELEVAVKQNKRVRIR